MVAPVGFELDRILDAQKFEPCNVWYVLRNPPTGSDSVGQFSLPFADKVLAAVHALPLLDSKIIMVLQSDLLGLVRAFAQAVREQRLQDPDAEFVFNTSGSTKLAQYAAVFVAGFCRAPVRLLYMQPKAEVVLAALVNAGPREIQDALERYLAHGECSAPFEPKYCPVIPFVQLTPAERAILQDLAKIKSRAMLSQLVPVVSGKVRSTSRSDIVKTGWSVNALEDLNLVQVKKEGTTKMVSITSEGELVAAALESNVEKGKP